MSETGSILTEIDFAKTILEHNQNLINLVDAKAGILLAADGVVLAVLGASQVNLTSQIEKLSFFLVTSFLIGSAICGALTIKARVIHNTPPTKIFFGSILQMKREQYRESFASTPNQILGDLLNNIYTLATIQKKKFAYLNASIYLIVAALVVLALMVISIRLL